MRLLRDESDKAIDEADEPSDFKSRIIDHYDSIGADLELLMHEWEQGKAALSSTMERHAHTRSSSANRLSVPLSPALSLGGTTAVEGSPHDALQALNGNHRLSLSRSSTTSSASDEQVFEAIAVPRQRSSLTREERLAKMKAERIRQVATKEKSQANTHMLKELETVIKLRPRGRTTGRMTSI